MNEVYNNEEYIEVLREKLTPARFEHSLCVAKSARKLALKYGADAEKAYTAGLVHDVMKNETPAVQLKIIKDADIILNCAERLNPKLWHAISGSVYIQKEFGIEDKEIINAVRYHTTARADMGLLEKVLYIADFISADRTYEGVELMRQAAEKSLDEAITEGLRFSIEELAHNGYAIHPDSVEAYNEMLLKNFENKNG